MPLDRPLPDDTREGLKMLWSVAEDQQIDINRHRDSLHKVWHVVPPKPREGMLVYADGVNWNPGSGAGYYVYYAGAWHPMSGSGGGGGGGYTTVQDEGVALTVRTTLNFVGAGVTATDDGTRTVVTIPGGGGAGAVTSVFTRTGAVIAATGDYTAAQVTNAVSTILTYADPSWITSLAYSKLTGVPSTFTPAAHVHAAADTTSGVFAVARLGTGTPSSANFLRGDGAWTVVPAGGVTSVFTRTGAVVAASGDYTAAQVTNAVSTLGSYPDPSWITSLAYAKITGAPTISAIQTPWLSNINGAGFTLTNVSNVSVYSAGGADLRLDPGVLLAGGGNIGTWSNNTLQLVTNGTAKVSVTTSGDVGIGPAVPVKRLHVNGFGAGGGMSLTGPAPTFSLSGPGDTDPNTQAWACSWSLATAAGHFALAAGDCLLATMGASRGHFYITSNYNSGADTARHLILQYHGGAKGNVGIGTTTPGSKLSVVGLPTSSAGLAAGDIWIDTAAGRVLKII